MPYIKTQSNQALPVLALDVASDLLSRIQKRCNPRQFEFLSVSDSELNKVERCQLLLINLDNFSQRISGFPRNIRNLLKECPCIGIYGFHPNSIESICKQINLSYLVPANELEHILFAIQRQTEQLIVDLGMFDSSSQFGFEQIRRQGISGDLSKIGLLNLAIPENELMNRDQFISILDKYLSALNRTENGSLALIEINHYLSGEGDASERQLLSKVMDSIKSRSRQFDLIGRFDKAIFAFFTTRFNANSFLVFVEHLRSILADQVSPNQDEFLEIKCNIGICFWDHKIKDSKHLIKGAEQARSTAAIGDGNSVQIYSAENSAPRSVEENENIAPRITAALSENRFRLIYQPIVTLKSKSDDSYAVLVRMIDPSGKHITPDRFLPAAEEDRLIGHIDQWVLRRIIEIVKISQAEGRVRRFFIKISGQSLIGDELVRCLFHNLKKAKIDGKALVFQIDYAEYLDKKDDLVRFINAVKKARCQVAFDHFGFGRYSLDDLKLLQLDFIKIDGTFTRHLLNNESYQRTVEKVQKFAELGGVQTIAKSVENADTLALLWNLGVDAVQGYFIQPPEEDMQFSFPF